ncbi:MAG: MBL fold metallo-hydrolase [Clostridiales bacterium]|nr:MBL fold metallo-hydrolase [Clostridiales bacterium]
MEEKKVNVTSDQNEEIARGITRRTFMKGVAAGVVAVSLGSVISGGGVEVKAATAKDASEEVPAKKITPDALLGEIAVEVVDAAGLNKVKPSKNIYGWKNTKESKAVLILIAKKALKWDKKMSLKSTMTREDFFVMLGKLMGLKGKTTVALYKFKDVADVSQKAYPLFNELYTRGVMTGDDTANVCEPKRNIMVHEVTEALNRAYVYDMAPPGMTLVPLDAPYLTKNFNRFGNMNPSYEAHQNIYLLKEEPFRIVDNVYYVGNTWTSAYLIDTGKGLILLDNSTQEYFPLLIESIYELGFNPKDIKKIILSHAHGDHYGCVFLLKQLCPDALTYVGDVDAPSMLKGMQKRSYNISDYGFGGNGYYKYNEGFIPDVLIKDYDHIKLGNTDIECITTPGHTDGVQSHFWTTPSGYRIGLYGGAGFSSMGTERLRARGFNDAEIARWQQIFVESIDKVWDKKVDVMLGNHPFHADLFEKHERFVKGDRKAFHDKTEWHRYLQELKDSYAEFLKLTPDEITEMYRYSYLLVFRDANLKKHDWPWVIVQ